MFLRKKCERNFIYKLLIQPARNVFFLILLNFFYFLLSHARRQALKFQLSYILYNIFVPTSKAERIEIFLKWFEYSFRIRNKKKSGIVGYKHF